VKIRFGKRCISKERMTAFDIAKSSGIFGKAAAV